VEPYGAPQLDAAVQLNVNENPYGPSQLVVDDLAAALCAIGPTLNRYPDREAGLLRTDLADYLGHGLDGSRVWAANGSNEVMQQVLQAFGGPGHTALSFAPTYSMYPEYARVTSTRWVTAPRSDAFEIDLGEALDSIGREQPEVILIASPNNPTGTTVEVDTLKAICAAAPGLVVVDEAYAEFRRLGTPSALALLDDYSHLAVTRTMSKAFALAGGRVGYVASSAEVVDALRVVRLPYHLSAVTQAVARVALAHRDELLARVDDLRDQRDATVSWLRSRGLRAADSDANFVLFGAFVDRRAVWQGLLDQGVLIRETGPAGWLRVSIGTLEQMEAFKDALDGVLQEEKMQ